MQSNWKKRDFNSHSQFNMSANCMNLFYWNKWQGEVIMHIVMIQNECLDHRKKNYKRISNMNMKDSSERWKKKNVHYYWKELLSNNSFSAFAKIMEPCNSQNTNGKNFLCCIMEAVKTRKHWNIWWILFFIILMEDIISMCLQLSKIEGRKNILK